MRETIEPGRHDRAAAGDPAALGRRPNIGIWEWFSLYLTGAFLIVFIAAHVIAVHYLGPIGSFTFNDVVDKLRSPLYLILDLGLLFFAFYHGLAGVRRVLVDLEIFSPTGLKVFTGVLIAIGLIGIYFGLRIFMAFKV